MSNDFEATHTEANFGEVTSDERTWAMLAHLSIIVLRCCSRYIEAGCQGEADAHSAGRLYEPASVQIQGSRRDF